MGFIQTHFESQFDSSIEGQEDTHSALIKAITESTYSDNFIISLVKSNVVTVHHMCSLLGTVKDLRKTMLDK